MTGRILITGATGYIGGRLVPRLLEQNYELRCLVREPAHLAAKPWRDQVEIVQADVLKPETLGPALEGVDSAYYLIHSMSSSARGFENRDRLAAKNFSQAAKSAGVRHIIYLGGLGKADEKLSKHLRSRQETGAVLAASGVPTTEFRASVIIGSGSIPFEMIRYLTERVPLMVTPNWVDTKTQPIAIRDVLSYLIQAVQQDAEDHRIVEIGGPDILSYRELMLRYAKIRGLKRYVLATSVPFPRLSAYWINLVTPIPLSIAQPLVEGLTSKVIVHNPEPAKNFEVTPISYDRAVQLALDRMSQGTVETLWSDAISAVPRGTPPAMKLTDSEGMLMEKRSRHSLASPEEVFKVISGIGGDRGWLAFDFAWQIRGFIDKLIGGVGMRRGRRDPDNLVPGDALDFWRVESVKVPQYLQLRAEMKVPGKAWLRFDVRPLQTGSEIKQTALFEPKGLMGFLYWWLLYPIHGMIFSAMIRAIDSRATKQKLPAVQKQTQ